MADHPPSSARGSRLLWHVPHLLFFVVAGTALVRLTGLNTPRCWEIFTISCVLAVVYAAGFVLWSAMGARVRYAWVAALLVLWTVLVVLVPPFLTAAYVWCAVPLAWAVLRALGRRGATVAVVAITVVLAGQLTRVTGRFDPEIVLIPVAAVWSTVALYRALEREQRRAGVLEERMRLAGDLHDTLAQELAGSVLLLQAAERSWDEPDVARTRVRGVTDRLSASLAETRRIIEDLTPAPLEQAGLGGALRLLCDRARQDGTAARVRFRSVGGPGPDLGEQAATALFRVAQGALANVREHAHATTLLVILRHHPDRVELDVRDDGVGFDPDAAPGPGRGVGLPSARARLREFGGDLEISTAPGRGTRIRVTVPGRLRSGAVVPVTSVAVR
ncbi:sensor histidine kinase [Amycolatopsis sp. lyj-346]|uniref:sensor histidine kinase n=1 Tax=Amycolatopsis sp. lyj-346 TaxID=2789289 RepID=UPI00397A193C